MLPTPTYVASWTSPTQDLEANDLARFRGNSPAIASVETDLGNGMTQVTYTDCAAAPSAPEA